MRAFPSLVSQQGALLGCTALLPWRAGEDSIGLGGDGKDGDLVQNIRIVFHLTIPWEQNMALQYAGDPIMDFLSQLEI